jgi:hypothetical protein
MKPIVIYRSALYKYSNGSILANGAYVEIYTLYSMDPALLTVLI